MSWIDTASLTLVLWSCAKGYLDGLYRTMIRLAGVLCAIVVAAMFQGPLVVYLNEEWQAEQLVVELLSKSAAWSVQTGNLRQCAEYIPRLTGYLAIKVLSAGTFTDNVQVAAAVAAAVLVKVLAAFFFFLFLAACLTLLLGLAGTPSKATPEWQKVLGALCGVGYGLVLSAVGCLALDALLIPFKAEFIRFDLGGSYLYLLAEFFIQRLF